MVAILVVDDDPVTQELFKRVLERDWLVAVTITGLEALEFLSYRAYSLIYVDYICRGCTAASS